MVNNTTLYIDTCWLKWAVKVPLFGEADRMAQMARTLGILSRQTKLGMFTVFQLLLPILESMYKETRQGIYIGHLPSQC